MKNFFFLFIIGVPLWINCSDDSSYNSEEPAQTSDQNYIQGKLRIKVSEVLSAQMESMHDSLQNAPQELSQLIDTLQVTAITRVFPFAGKYEARTRAEGLHRWYDIEFNESQSVTRAAEDFEGMDGIEIVEKREPVHSTSTYNDPSFDIQWNFNNTTNFHINLMDAWNLVAPNPEVVVAVVDGGIDIEHPDLTDNVWVNTAELNGMEGVDDDGNGYIDDIHGYNFVSDNGLITAHNHGSHVSGIIAAKNNNGTGICSIAGGSSKEDGVRVMSCQIFQTNSNGKDDGSSSLAAAIKYGADNGALISQNSWCYDNASYLYSSDKAAIDYFVKYAGMDENGDQTGLMRGGVVVFAAGNEHKSIAYPSSYEAVVAVGATESSGKFASYSNYGSWVDICAPGTGIYSTVANNSYATYDGTSMACPHVSGVAALIISKYGGTGFSNDSLKSRILKTATSIDEYNPYSIGYFGSGLLNAYAALTSHTSEIAPDAVTGIEGEVLSNSVTLSWKVTPDEDEVKAFGFRLFYSEKEDFGFYKYIDIPTNSYGVGDVLSKSISGLSFNTSYYFKIQSYDASRNFSADSPVVSFCTSGNRAPVVTCLDSSAVTLKACQKVTLHFKAKDPDGHSFIWAYSDENGDSSAELVNDSIFHITIDAAKMASGNYFSTLTVKDSYGLLTDYDLSYRILENHIPTVAKIPDVYIGQLGQHKLLYVNDYFNDDDGGDLTYTYTISTSTVSAYISQTGEMLLSASAYGMDHITVTATDAKGLSCSASFAFVCRNDSAVLDLYPNPVSSNLYVRVGENIDTNIHIRIYNSIGTQVYSQSAAVATFAPAVVDVSHLSGGSYSVEIDLNGQTIQQTIVKL